MNLRLKSYRRVVPYVLAFAACAAIAVVASADPVHVKRTARVLRPGYAEMVRRWHMPLPEPRTMGTRPALVLEVLNTSERLALLPASDEGGFDDDDLGRAAHALRDPRANEEHAMDSRILDLVYRVERHFHAGAVRVVSGFRVPHGRSNHGKGRAIDLVIPGTSDYEVARFARTIGFVGVGVYPKSGFVHVDSRPKSFFWVDTSGPGQRSRIVPVLSGTAAIVDAKALERGDAPPSDDADTEDDDH